ncbi:hypothetical protein AB8216_000008 [Vibrio alginolyticus]
MMKRVLLALNMFVLHLLTGQAVLTISGWSYTRLRQGKRLPQIDNVICKSPSHYIAVDDRCNLVLPPKPLDLS